MTCLLRTSAHTVYDGEIARKGQSPTTVLPSTRGIPRATPAFAAHRRPFSLRGFVAPSLRGWPIYAI